MMDYDYGAWSMLVRCEECGMRHEGDECYPGMLEEDGWVQPISSEPS